ncbi:S-layer homology domain-containing protein [Cohnella ginsengisoli]|uniref:S-layer homology domain-containing protein n=1 Tax=Cohnella ginsengisoli TaxID=425004 RepID=A0A9X4KI20_9BACL|nr:S-layer homology domain-containing protein [Cohnella ginsengisoli]MDG0792386.1 S-layer homology domain-containing protein [Cohnella ginsengisoli]
MAEAGILTGYDDGTFRADRQIARAEMAAMLARAAGLKPEQEQESALPAFADRDQIPNWARASVAAAVEAGIVRGKTGNRFAPADVAKRAEAVAAIMNLLHWQEK